MMKDKAVERLIKREAVRQKKFWNLIASENYVSADVLKALGSVLTNKYAEGYVSARYYGGNEVIDMLEKLAQDRARKTFKLSLDEWHVNVQPLSGSPANIAVYLALVPFGGKIMGMSLDHGGHLTHGHKVSLSGKAWKQVSYGVDTKTETLNYDDLLSLAQKERPNLIVAGFTAYPRIIDWKRFREIADSVGAILTVDMSHIAGLIAGDQYPTPFMYADVVTSTVHKTLRGPRAAMIFCKKEYASKIDKAVFPGLQGGPHINQIAGTAIALKEASQPSFRAYARQVIKNAHALAEALKMFGWRLVSGGTDTHLILVDTWMEGKGISGKEASDRLEREGIVVNKNTIPYDTRKPADPSGIRLGTAAETTRGKKEKDFIRLAKKIDTILRS